MNKKSRKQHMRKKTVWEKWKDPMLSNYDEVEWPGYDLDEDGDIIPIHTVEKQPVMHTPFGMISVVDSSLASSSFDFWIMHTNFGINNNMLHIIEQVPGVESLEIYTRYRARVGFPRSGLFKPGEVMHEIDNAMRQLDYDIQNQLLIGLELNVAERVIKARDGIDKKHDHWAILVVPNGNIEVICSDKIDKKYNDKFQTLQQTYESVGGRLLTSESE